MAEEYQETEDNRLRKFLNLYANFVYDNSQLSTNIDKLLKDASETIPRPKQTSQSLEHLYNEGKKLARENSSEMVPRLKLLKEDSLSELIVYIEQLNYKLNVEYEEEVNKGVKLGIYKAEERK